MAGLFIGVCVCVRLCELVQILGVLFFNFNFNFLFYLLINGVAGELLGAALKTYQPSFIRSVGRGWEDKLNIYPLHVKIILKIANRCRTAVCRTCLHEDGWCCFCARECE